MSYKPTRVIEGVEAYRVNGTPADCVTLGMFHNPGVDVVLSGVNLGPNLGNGMWHSGTLAAAYQGSLLGARGIAFSTPTVSDAPDLAGLDESVARVLELLLPRDDLRLVNVNLPARARGVYWARQAIEKYDGEVVPAKDPYGRPVFWLAVTQLAEHAEGTDLWAFERGYITITPLRQDLTRYSLLPLENERAVEFEGEVEPQLLHESEEEEADRQRLGSAEWTKEPAETTSSS